MKTSGSAFAWIDDQAYVIVNFTLDPSFGFPSIQDLLEELLRHCSGGDILLLRRLTKKEKSILEGSIRDREHEAWAQITASRAKNEF